VAGRQHAVGAAPLAGEPALDEGIGNLARAQPAQLVRRSGQRQLLGQDAGGPLVGSRHLHGGVQHLHLSAAGRTQLGGLQDVEGYELARLLFASSIGPFRVSILWWIGLTLLVTWVLAFPIGIYSAVRQHSVGDYFFTFLGFLGLATPNFMLALVAAWISFRYFGFTLGGVVSPEYQGHALNLGKILDVIGNLWMPVLAPRLRAPLALTRTPGAQRGGRAPGTHHEPGVHHK
jgi:hypothetical protein